MASMVKNGAAIAMLLASAAAFASLSSDQRTWYRAQLGLAGGGTGGYIANSDPVGDAVLRWNRLRQSDTYAFSDYAAFLLANPGWPGEQAMRRTAEKRFDQGATSPAEITRFFDAFPPLTSSGRTRFAEALLASGRTDAARDMARAAWIGGAQAPNDEASLLSRFGSTFTAADQDQRMDRLLWDRNTGAALRQIVRVSPARYALFDARIAMQTRRADAGAKAAALDAQGTRDAGFVADKARYLRDSMQFMEARNWLARPRTLDAPPLDAEKYLEILLNIAKGAAGDNQSSLVYDIARQADGAFPAGTDIRQRPYGDRDDYTSLVWLGGYTTLRKLGRPSDAIALFDRYARASQTPAGMSRGFYWAGRAALAGGNPAAANGYFAQAAAHPDQFYGQLACERLSQIVQVPQPAAVIVADAQRSAFNNSGVVRAARFLGELDDWADQSLFLRTIAGNAKDDSTHALAAELSRSIGRPDLGVMVARNARNSGASDFVPTGFPQVTVPPGLQSDWVMIHAIARQESQFDRQAVSRVGARGLMQLMPATARAVSAKLGLPYEDGRLTSDPQYNVMLGSTFFSSLLNNFGGNHVLAIAAYNAGPGNVRKWLAANGDPRTGQVDVIDWIEAIPFSETRTYVQHVLENAVVYDALNPGRARMPERNRLSAYLGKTNPG
jgi:soluble lytic murein transglycosylase